MKILVVASSLLWLFSFDSVHAASENSLRSLVSHLGIPLEVTSDGAVLDGAAYFVGDDGLHGRELWRTNGTVQGTWLVKDISSGGRDAFPGQPMVFNGRLYFPATDGINGRELWTSDGTESGTYMLRDIYPGGGDSFPGELTTLNGRLYFRAYEPDCGWELWTTNGMNQTYRVKDIAIGEKSSFPTYLTAFNGRLYFRAQDAMNGAELWTSDGTDKGTYLLKDIIPGAVGGAPTYLNVVDGRLYFRAFNAPFGTSIWVSDGIEENTQPMYGVTPGHVKLSWISPATNVDGTPLVNIAGYKIVFGLTRGIMDHVVEVNDPQATSHSIASLPPGLYYFAMRAVNSLGIESSNSPVVINRIF